MFGHIDKVTLKVKLSSSLASTFTHSSIHPCITSSLCRLHVHALLIIFLMDLGDVLLELSKVVFHCRYRKGKYHKGAAWTANAIFAVFTWQL